MGHRRTHALHQLTLARYRIAPCCGSQLLIHKLVTGAIADTAIIVISAAIASGVATAITAIVATITAITSAVSRAITATVAAAVTTSITAAIDTARRRRRRSIDLATRRRWRRSIRDGTRGNDRSTGDGEVGCFGLGRNGGGSECERCRGHDGYPA